MTLGGTIACAPNPQGGVTPSVDPEFMTSVLAAAVHSATGLPAVQLVAGASVPSPALDITGILALIERFERLVDEGACGLVVTTGTDTLEEIAFLLDLLWGRKEPIVVLGAMRHGGLPGSDGPSNLRDGLRVAAHDRARGAGCLVTMNGQIHHAWQVRKSHTGQLSAFESAVGGPAGSVQEETVRMTSGTVIDRPVFRLGPSASIPPVALMRASLADDARALKVVDSLGYQGLVVETMGGGSIPPAWAPVLERLTNAMPVVYTSRTFAGPTLRSTYGGPNAELHLRRVGLTPAGLLDGLKARLLLALLLASEVDAARMHTVWDMFDVPESCGHRPELVAPDVAAAR